jgi:hypothetical protein
MSLSQRSGEGGVYIVTVAEASGASPRVVMKADVHTLN